MRRSIIDQPMAEALSFAEVMALKQMDRVEMMGKFATHDQFIHFHRLVGYWSALLDRLLPDVLLMPTSPHVTYDYLAYVLARRRGIPTIMFEYVGSDGLLMAINGFEDGLPPLQAAYRRLRADPPPAPIVLSERMEAYWRSLRGSHQQATPYWLRLTRDVGEAVKVAKDRADAEARRLADEEVKRLADQQTKENEERKLAESEADRWPNQFRLALRLLRGPVAANQLLLPLSHSSSKLVGSPVEPEVAVPPTLAPPPLTDGHYNGCFFKDAETPQSLAREAAEFRTRHIKSLRRRYDELEILPDWISPTSMSRFMCSRNARRTQMAVCSTTRT